MAATLFEKIWANHEINPELIYIDLHLLHEVTSAQAFEGLRLAGRRPRRPEKSLATVDHNLPTNHPRSIADILDPLSRKQVETLEANCREYGIPLLSIDSGQRGIVHMIGPELGLTQPGMTIVCGDSHTSSHGALGALAYGIGTSEVEHVLATQTLVARKMPTMRINYLGRRRQGTTAKDCILYTIGELGSDGMSGHFVEYAGPVIAQMSIEERLTICNMSIEAGARAGAVSPDQTTVDYLRERIPVDEETAARWIALASDPDAEFASELTIEVDEITPMVTWGTTPSQVLPVSGIIPEPSNESEQRAIEYMGLEPGQALTSLKIDEVFIGSCTNGRLSDLREAAAIVRGEQVAKSVRARVVPGSETVRRHAEAEGLDQVFIAAGFEWRSAGCSSCLGMADPIAAGRRVASTSNRNFEGRQGRGARSHLMSPAMAALAAIRGRLAIPDASVSGVEPKPKPKRYYLPMLSAKIGR